MPYKNKSDRAANAAKYRVENKDKPRYIEVRRRIKRKADLKRLGWTLEAFSVALVNQENKCEICKSVLNLDNKRGKDAACADHKHDTPPKPRGILCANCNFAIGLLKENTEIFLSAISYLKKYE